MAKKTFITPYPAEEFTIDFSSQTEWRWLIATAFYLGSIGGGTFILSVYLKFTFGLVLGFLIIAVGKSVAHLLYLGHPLRFYWAFTQPHRSWISRGLIAVFVFIIFGGLYVASLLPWFSWLPWEEGNSAWMHIFKALAVFSALVVMCYTGFVMAYSPAIPLWNNSMLPVLFLCLGFGGGASIILLMSSIIGYANVDIHFIDKITRLMVIINFILVIFYLLAIYKGSVGAQEAVRVLIYKAKGISLLFDGVVMGLGFIVPLLIIGYLHWLQLQGPAAYNLVAFGAFLELIGGFFLRFTILRAGVYNPVY